jgi:hypothetical protein
MLSFWGVSIMSDSQSPLYGASSILVGLLILVLAVLVDGFEFERITFYVLSTVFLVIGCLFFSR